VKRPDRILGTALSPTAATGVVVTAAIDADQMSETRTITWTPTYIDDDSGQAVTVRRGDSLLLTAYEEGGTTLEIDVDSDGTPEYTGDMGERFSHCYDAAGEYLATAKIDGVEVGTLTVTVIDVDLHGPIACQVGYKREKFVPIEPAAHATEVVFSALDPDYLGDVSVKEYTWGFPGHKPISALDRLRLGFQGQSPISGEPEGD